MKTKLPNRFSTLIPVASRKLESLSHPYADTHHTHVTVRRILRNDVFQLSEIKILRARCTAARRRVFDIRLYVYEVYDEGNISFSRSVIDKLYFQT